MSKEATNEVKQVRIIYGAPGSGKSKLVRNIVKDGAYAFSYKYAIEPKLCDMAQLTDLYEMLSGKEITESLMNFLQTGVISDKSEVADTILLRFCYEVSSILNMNEPFHTLVFDGLPKNFNDTMVSNIVALVERLKELGFTVFFVTSKPNRLQLFEDFFGDELEKIVN